MDFDKLYNVISNFQKLAAFTPDQATLAWANALLQKVNALKPSMVLWEKTPPGTFIIDALNRVLKGESLEGLLQDAQNDLDNFRESRMGAGWFTTKQGIQDNEIEQAKVTLNKYQEQYYKG